MTDSDEEMSAARLGRTVGGRWRLESVLGIGGMATVYAGRNASGAVAAIKILHPEMGMRREIRERFLREGYVANRIGHPGVVQALEHGETGDEVFLAMELLGGETLRARVKRHGQLPVGEVLDYSDQILDVLALAHEKGVVHRDLKPDNLFVTNEGRIKILDFGLARVLDGVPTEHRTRTGVALGTLAYMAPEQALGRRAEIDGRVDIFALGATMFRVLTGRRVHEAESEAELLMAMASRPAPPLAAVLPTIAPPVAGVVDLALAFSRDARYPDARTMQGDVRALRQGQPGPYATQRLSSREEATRAEPAPTTSQRTQPLAATMPSQPRSPLLPVNSTVPMPAYSAGVVMPIPGYGDAAAAQQPPVSVRTAPLTAHPANVPGPASFASTMPSTQPGAVPPFVAPSPVAAQSATAPAVATSAAAPASPKARGSLALVLVLAGAGVALAASAGAWYYFARHDGDATAAVTATAAPAARFEAPPPGTTTPAAPAPTVAENAEAPGARPEPKPFEKKEGDAPAAPSASAAPAVTPSASAAATAPPPAPEPSASSAAPPSPASPAAPAPSVAPVPPSPPASAAPQKKGRGRGKNG